MNELDSPETYVKYDPNGMLRHINNFAKLCRHAWQLASDFKLPTDFGAFNKIVILGMGGSAIGGDLVSSLINNEAKVPVITYRGYLLPSFVDSKTLIIASSYSGNTDETLSAFIDSLKTGAKHLVITTGGVIKTTAESNGIPVFHFNYKSQPRAALPFSFIPLLIFLQKLNLISDKSNDIAEAISVLKDYSQELNERVPLKSNQAKQLAIDLHGKLPVIYGSEITSEVAHRWKTQLNENSKAWAFHEVFPELNHNAIVGYSFPQEIASAIMVILVKSSFLSDPVKKRYRITCELLEKAGISYNSVSGLGERPLSQMMSLILLGDYASFYLSILNKTNPTPVEEIDFLKSQLASG